MSDHTTPNQAPATAPPAAATPPLEGKALEMAERAKRGDLPGSVGGTRRGWMLLIAATLWLAFALWHASFGPARGLFATSIVYLGALALALMWLGTIMVLVARKRGLAFILLAPVPVALAAWAFVPWHHWLFAARLKSADTELRALAAEHAWIGENAPRPLDRTVAGITFSHIDRTQNIIRLIINRASDGSREGGVMLVPAGSEPRAPSDMTFSVNRPITNEWHEYALKR